jgi:hypothetical protein
MWMTLLGIGSNCWSLSRVDHGQFDHYAMVKARAPAVSERVADNSSSKFSTSWICVVDDSDWMSDKRPDIRAPFDG